jgi:hypothetical protein
VGHGELPPLAAVGAGAAAGAVAADVVEFWAATSWPGEADGVVAVVSEILITGAWTGETSAIWALATGVAGALVACAGDMMCSARAMSEPDPDDFCAATTPNAARPTVSNAAKIMTTTRIVPSATNRQYQPAAK